MSNRKQFGEVFTPRDVIEDMLDHLDQDIFKKDLKWLDPCAGHGQFFEVLIERLKPHHPMEHILKNMLYFYEIQEESCQIIRQKFGDNINLIQADFLKEEIENFDVCIANPPYQGVKHLRFLEKCYNKCNKILFVHPGTWLYDNKQISKTFNRLRELTKEHFISYKVVENSSERFGISSFVDILITFFDKDQSGIGDKIYEIDVHGDSEIYKSIKAKILKYCEKSNLQMRAHINGRGGTNRINKSQKKKYVGFSCIRGNPNKPDFYTFIQTKNEESHYIPCKYVDRDNSCILTFETQKETLNFFEYLKLKVVRFCLSIYKINQHIGPGELKAVPYMLDYSKKWTNETVAKEIGLDSEELDFVLTWIPGFYPEETHTISLPLFRGSPRFSFTRVSKKHLHFLKTYKIVFNLDSKEEQQNFFEYLELDITKFCLSVYKINQHLCSGELKAVPYMLDYSKKWTNETVAKELGLTAEELEFCKQWVSNN